MKLRRNEEHFSESDYPIQDKPSFPTFGSIIETSPQGSIISFVFDDRTRILLGFQETILYKEYNLSHNPVGVSSFDKFFLECDIAKGQIYKQKRSGIIHNWIFTVNPAYKYVESFAGGITWYMM